MKIRLDTLTNSTHLQWMGNPIRLPIRSCDTSNRLSGPLATLAPGTGNPRHVHTLEAECFYVIEGEIDVAYSNETAQLHADDIVYLPVGLPHQLKSAYKAETKLLVLLTQGDIEKAFLSVAGESKENVRLIGNLIPLILPGGILYSRDAGVSERLPPL